MNQKKPPKSHGRLGADMFKRSFLGIVTCCLVSISHASVPLNCQRTKKSCVEKGGTKTIQGLEVTLDCWKYEIQKNCTVNVTDTCASLRANGCTPIGARCTTVLNNTCLVQENTFQCSIRECHAANNEKIDRFCADGTCIDHASTHSTDFNDRVSELASLGGAATDVTQTQSPQLFSGHAMECADNMLGYKNCCRNSGWGKDINLAHCTDGEKALGQKREKGLAIAVGRYCHNRVDYGAGNACMSHHQVYCVFDSKIAKAIQAQGRKKQLNIDFGQVSGDASHPNCRAITAQELQRIDFDQIDFSALVDDIKQTMKTPSQHKSEQKIIDRIKAFYSQGKSHD